MQRTDQSGKKNKGRTGESYLSNAIPSLRLMQKIPPPDQSISQKIITAVASYVETKAASVLNSAPLAAPQKPGVEEDSERIAERLKKAAEKLVVYQKELGTVEAAIKQYRKDKIEIPPDVLSSQRRLRETIDNLQLLEQLDGLSENIREHSARRIDLFFLLLIAVYNTQVTVQKAHTGRQHGSGSEETMTAGCHPSLFPCLTFKKIPPTAAAAITNSIWSLFSSASTVTAVQLPEQLLENTHFAEVLNMTTQLPVCVNAFDCHMERAGSEGSSLVQTAEGILNRTARGVINPVQGLDEFCDAIYSCLNSLHEKYIQPEINYGAKGTRGKTPKSFAEIWKYEREGALRMMRFYDNADHTKKHAAANWNYVYAMLSLHKLPLYQRAASQVYSGYINARVLEMQQEIYKWKFDTENNLFKTGLVK